LVGLFAALSGILVFPLVAMRVADGIGGAPLPTPGDPSAPVWKSALYVVLVLSGLILWALIVLAFGLFGPIDRRITRLRASGSV
jgi:hypothetical protein